ncbi:MAG TPA: hypothetical protein VFQ65_07530 [Kofleriaceae bacterium]|nr:hypothetical protein [Kofleriaceae bacterium]
MKKLLVVAGAAGLMTRDAFEAKLLHDAAATGAEPAAPNLDEPLAH